MSAPDRFHHAGSTTMNFPMLLGIAVVVCSMAASAQPMLTGVVSGRDADGIIFPLRGAIVTWPGTSIGTYTDSLGRFAVQRRGSTDTLRISSIGYETAFIVVGERQRVDVTLEIRSAEDVTVIAERKTITDAPVRTEIISKRDLTKAACCSLAESFEKSPTVEVSYSDAVSGARQIQLLGLRGTYVQILTEAVPAIRGMEQPWGLDHIPGPFMESVSISKGAATVTHGYEAMTGLINVEYRKPATADPLFVNVYGNSLGRGEFNVVTATPVADHLSTTTMLHGRLFTGNVDQNNDGFLDLPMFRQGNALHRWMYNDDEIEVQVLGRAVVDDYAGGTPGGSFGDISPSTDLSVYRITSSLERYDGFVKIGLLNPFESLDESSVALIVNASHNRSRSVFGTRLYDGTQSTVQARAVMSLCYSEALRFVGGLSFLYDAVNESILRIDLDRIERVPGVFAEATLRPLDDVTLIAGGRVDQHNLYGTFWTPRLHLKWDVAETTALRASVGKGYRVPVVVAENLSSFITSMIPEVVGSIRPEISWNTGVSATHTLEIAGRAVTVDAELYHTMFENQLLVDFDASPGKILFRNLEGGRSYATSAMVQILFSPVNRLDLALAQRWIDVQATFGGVLRERPMMSRQRTLLTASYATPGDVWRFDATFVYQSGGRLPSTEHLPVEHRRPTSFPGFARVNGQVARAFGNVEVYLGVENATNFIQTDPIITPNRPYGPHFDAAMTWGPTDPRMIYAGVRWTVH
ncbi:MAG: TonB-dependent receptor [Candidatus Kapabacteria bacterium]|nr:TonB-dependent receptor [Candidatus Kapabacteria bacterium]